METYTKDLRSQGGGSRELGWGQHIKRQTEIKNGNVVTIKMILLLSSAKKLN